jgi:hypothetical protein
MEGEEKKHFISSLDPQKGPQFIDWDQETGRMV